MKVSDILNLGWLDIWRKLAEGAIKPIAAKRWTLSIDDERIGNVITHHTVGVDETGAWSKWVWEYDDDNDAATEKLKGEIQSWITPNKRHVIKVDGKDVEKDSVRVKVTSVGFPPKGVYIVIHRFIDGSGEPRAIRLDGRL